MVKRVAYFGPAGTYTEQAAVTYCPEAELLPYPTIPAVAAAVEAGMADEGVVPIENSLEGAVTFTLDLLIHQSKLRIRSEVVLPIHHCLMAKPGTRAEDIKVIYSHPQALAQCRAYLERRFPQAQPVASLSTSAAVEDAQKSQATAAAISSRRAAELYGVEVLAENIEDSPNNVTRFVALAATDHPPTGADKTSLCFSFDYDAPGILYTALGEFARRGINLAKIESRPDKRTLGRYIFLVDVEGHREDAVLQDALESIRARVSTFKVFGSYPRQVSSAI
jgi:prephenate dehydratase